MYNALYLIKKSRVTKVKKNKNQPISTNTLFVKVTEALSKIIIGQKKPIEEILITFFSNGHVLLNGLPGMAKTLTAKSLAKILGFDYNRIQFTPDLIPLDLLGYETLNKTNLSTKFVKGPIFTQFLLADEINRAPAKTQSALLQAMEEKEITIMGKTTPLPHPFFVIATQNPTEQKGTYELPEAQIDRFMSMVTVNYPSVQEELSILESNTVSTFSKLKPVLTKADFTNIQKSINNIGASQEAKEWIVKIIQNTRPEKTTSSLVKKYVSLGCSPRAAKYVFSAAKTLAWIRQCDYIEKSHIERVLPMIFRHRISLNYAAVMEGVTAQSILEELIKK